MITLTTERFIFVFILIVYTFLVSVWVSPSEKTALPEYGIIIQPQETITLHNYVSDRIRDAIFTSEQCTDSIRTRKF